MFSLVDSEEEKLKDSSVADSYYDFDADIGKPVSLEHENEDSVGVSALDESGEDANGRSFCDSTFLKLEERENGDELTKGEQYVQLASRDPVELYRWESDQALAIYIGLSFFPTAVSKFQNFFCKKRTADIANYLVSLGPSNAAVKFLFPIFVEYCLEEFPDEIKRFRGMVKTADLTKPHTWFPFARAMKLKIIYHCGPTNSGKTYNALQRFMDAKKGLYFSPLRLLAMEVFDKVNGLGIYCCLPTGQEKKHVPFSNHAACTVEMVSTDELYDVAVIDEIQMLADPYRGYAWTRALLGLKADAIHLCSNPSVLDIFRKICQDTGDELYEQHFAFSRREIFEVKMAIEKQTNHRFCVICRQQASLFNDQNNEYDVLVASDAVGMVLNLKIRKVKQIAGRAGRRGCLYPDGFTTTLHLNVLDYLIECLKQPFDDVRKKIANMLEKVKGLSLEERYNFCFAPVNVTDPKAMYHLLRFASSYSQKVPVNIAMGMLKGSARNDAELLDLETRHQVVSMYMWLSNHFKEET
ncbi:hypothetical protein L6164_007314 [Bauhinia variegata]|uniref:Uncharacterized protein n=1 Tax=Bauhinia variegata TaxID=167791 RepID=A0ACB9PD71_BAUVA|nr:hypothetical protein L6164_007314 [Bauhinia variegata]